VSALRYGLFMFVNRATGEEVNRWVMSYDVNAYQGIGVVTFTADPRRALAFVHAAEALRAWRTRSTVRPNRPDGKPNRPLTAFTTEIRPIPGPEAHIVS